MTAHHVLLIALRSLIVLAALTVGLRLAGKRGIAQLTMMDLVLLMALTNAVQNAMTEGRGELIVGVVAAGTLLLSGRATTALFARYPGLEMQFAGTPTILIHNGHIDEEHMRREGISRSELDHALRSYGVEDPKAVRLAVLEVDGAISVVQREKKH